RPPAVPGRPVETLLQRLSWSCGRDASSGGSIRASSPLRTQARWLGAKRGGSRPSFVSRLAAQRARVGPGGLGRCEARCEQAVVDLARHCEAVEDGRREEQPLVRLIAVGGSFEVAL